MKGMFSLLLVATAAWAAPKVTFTRDIAPIIYNRCAECHRAGQIAPMSLLTYEQARPWAASMREKVRKSDTMVLIRRAPSVKLSIKVRRSSLIKS